MAQKKGLGSGLNALFGNFEDMDVSEAENIVSYKDDGTLTEGVSEVELSKIEPNPAQPRKHFDELALRELASSIRTHGLIQPIVLVRRGNKYMIIAGERRFRACKLAELKKVPAIVRSFSERQQKEIALIENLQREDLNPIEEARAIQALIDEYSATQEEIAATLGKSRPVITNSLRLLTLESEVVELILMNRLSAGHGRTLASIRNRDTQLAYAKAACDKKMSVRELELLVNAYMNPAKKGDVKLKPPITAELKELVFDMQRIFATKVKAVGTEEKGRIYIDYYTKDDLNRIFELMDSLKK